MVKMMDRKEETELIASVREILTNQKNDQKAIDEHHHTLFGNGQPGLAKTVDRMREKAKWQEEKAKRQDRHMWIVWGCLLSGAVAFVISCFD